jgi:hypothetical protein
VFHDDTELAKSIGINLDGPNDENIVTHFTNSPVVCTAC